MASHGVTRATGSKTEKQRQKEQEDIVDYRALVDDFNIAAEKNDCSRAALDITSRLLARNPEYYTVWNHRRRVLQRMMRNADSMSSGGLTDEDESRSLESVAKPLISSDLEFLMPLLKEYPKCYWIWNHRQWLLQQASEKCSTATAKSFWQHEFDLVGIMLTRDTRNFHGWSYRRTVVAEMRNFQASKDVETPMSLTEQEFAYTWKLISKNFSNFSAWHQRSKLIPQLLDERDADDSARRKVFDQELETVEDMLYNDPMESSLWYYHQFLMTQLMAQTKPGFVTFTDLERKKYLLERVDVFRQTLDDYGDCKWIFVGLLDFAIMLKQLPGEGTCIPPDEAKSWLERLQVVDPMRKGRWADLRRKLDI